MLENENGSDPEWLDNQKINEAGFAVSFLKRHPLQCLKGQLYDIDGLIADENTIKYEVYRCIEPYITSGIANKAQSLLEAIKIKAYVSEIEIFTDRIHLQNGTLSLDGCFTEEKEFCRNRLTVNFNPEPHRPRAWFEFLNDLLEPDDILTLQEYMGYCLIPTTIGQKMLLIIGKGGEGKSRIGRVLRAIFGDNMNTGSIQKVETDRFARADLEGKLVFLDDDIKMEALPQTNNIKALVTLEDKIDLERKGKQSEQGLLYARFICLGNGNLSSLNDRSYGFFRRQILLTTKERTPDRLDDPYLGERLISEKEGILIWCIIGLKRLQENNYHFTISEKAKQNLKEAMQDGNNTLAFLESVGYIERDKAAMTTSKALYIAYACWCEDNLAIKLSEKQFVSCIKKEANLNGLTYSNNIPTVSGKTARGFQGIRVIMIHDEKSFV